MITLCFASSCAHAQRSVTLAWDRNTETNIAGYKLHYGTASRAYTNSIDVGSVTSASVTNLVAGLTYLFAVTAYNAAGVESDFSAEVSHTVTNVVTTNLPPTLAAIGDVTINEDSGSRSVSVTGITAGGEIQAISVTASATPQSLIPGVQVSYTSPNNSGTLSFAPAANASGTATVMVAVSDGLLQTTRSFSVTVIPVNDPPAISALPSATVAAQTVTALQSVQITDIDTAALNLAVEGASSDTNVIPNANILLGTTGLSRTLSVHPLRAGTATVTLRVSDGLAQSSQSFLLTVTNAVATNAPPTLAAIGDFVVNEDSGPHFVALDGIGSGGESQILTVTASSMPESLIASPQVSYISSAATGFVSFATAPNASGTGTITVTVSDGLAETSRSFLVTVNPVNDPPTMAVIPAATVPPQTITALQSVVIADVDTAASKLDVVGTSSDTNVLPHANILVGTSGFTRTLSVQPLRTGVATVTLTVSDGLAQSSQSFVLTVTNTTTAQVQARGSYDPAIRAVTISWDSQVGAVYRVLSKSSLAQPTWANVTGNLRATAPTTSWTNLNASSQSTGFYIIEKVSQGRAD